MILKRIHAVMHILNTGKETIYVCFRVNRSVQCTLLEVGRVHLEHTTLTKVDNAIGIGMLQT